MQQHKIAIGRPDDSPLHRPFQLFRDLTDAAIICPPEMHDLHIEDDSGMDHLSDVLMVKIPSSAIGRLCDTHMGNL